MKSCSCTMLFRFVCLTLFGRGTNSLISEFETTSSIWVSLFSKSENFWEKKKKHKLLSQLMRIRTILKWFSEVWFLKDFISLREECGVTVWSDVENSWSLFFCHQDDSRRCCHLEFDSELRSVFRDFSWISLIIQMLRVKCSVDVCNGIFNVFADRFRSFFQNRGMMAGWEKKQETPTVSIKSFKDSLKSAQD
jgi:hypothetical protein